MLFSSFLKALRDLMLIGGALAIGALIVILTKMAIDNHVMWALWSILGTAALGILWFVHYQDENTRNRRG